MVDHAGPGPIAHSLMGGGTLVYIKMDVIGTIGQTTQLTVGNVLFNGGDVCNNATSGDLTIIKRPTTVTITSTPNPSTYGDSVTFDATVSSAPEPPVDGGTVSFYEGGDCTTTGT